MIAAVSIIFFDFNVKIPINRLQSSLPKEVSLEYSLTSFLCALWRTVIEGLEAEVNSGIFLMLIFWIVWKEACDCKAALVSKSSAAESWIVDGSIISDWAFQP